MTFDNGMDIPDSDKHWTDAHIFYDDMTEEWVGYDEGGIELCRHLVYDDVRDALVIYAHHLNSENW